jgi:transcriptional regulator with XRE-family HTH domain
MDYGKAVKIARALAGLQQKDLAKAAGLDPSYLSLIEMGKRTPSLSAIEKLSNALGIPTHLLTLLATGSDDLRLADPTELKRVSESLAHLLINYDRSSPPRKRKQRNSSAP